ncbi:MAG: hypothetical protein K8T20_11935 [Planctomycetes bacterium]|nr:hypothetical protein [Planctomycetota bacterium]
MNAKKLMVAVAVLVLGIVVARAWADDGDAKGETEGRYRLHNGVNRDTNLVFKIDTATGKTWVLSKGGDWDVVLH